MHNTHVILSDLFYFRLLFKWIAVVLKSGTQKFVESIGYFLVYRGTDGGMAYLDATALTIRLRHLDLNV